MEHNSLFIIGPKTNNSWLHEIKEETDAPNNGASYSIIYRNTVTFKLPNYPYVFGPRSVFKTKEELQEAITTNIFPNSLNEEKSNKLLVKLYNIENKQPITLDTYRPIIESSYY